MLWKKAYFGGIFYFPTKIRYIYYIDNQMVAFILFIS